MVSPTRRYVVLSKKLGETPLQTLEAFKDSNPEYKNVPATYAGRLDPMAEGNLLVLLGDECKNQEKYRGLDKEYEIEVLLDVSTDTGDVLGLPSYAKKNTALNTTKLSEALRSLIGSKEIPYPAFSSKTVNGKPLFLYSLEGTLGSIEIPTHIETIYSIQVLDSTLVTKDIVEKRIYEILSHAPRSDHPTKTLGADFRQDEIRDAWKNVFANIEERTFQTLTLRITCASGSYMRTLAERIGRTHNTNGMAVSIKRNKIGKYQKLGPISFWTKEYR